LKKLIFFFLFFATVLHGQQVEQYSFAMLHDGLRNPAAVGTSESLQAVGLVRQQWAGFSGSPSSQYFSLDMPVGIMSGGVSTGFQQTNIGAHKIQRIQLGISYQKVVGDDAFVAIGTRGGLLRIEYDGSKLRTPGGDYGNGQVNHHDVLLSSVPFSGNTYTVDFGLYSRYRNLGIGVSVLNALAGKAKIDPLSIPIERHYFAQANYKLEVSSAISLQLRLQAYANNKIVQSQAMVMGVWNGVYSLGISLRGIEKKTRESVGGIAGIRLNEHFQLFYSYEYNILPLRTVFDANHEVAVVYTLNKKLGEGRLPKVIYNPRYF